MEYACVELDRVERTATVRFPLQTLSQQIRRKKERKKEGISNIFLSNRWDFLIISFSSSFSFILFFEFKVSCSFISSYASTASRIDGSIPKKKNKKRRRIDESID